MLTHYGLHRFSAHVVKKNGIPPKPPRSSRPPMDLRTTFLQQHGQVRIGSAVEPWSRVIISILGRGHTMWRRVMSCGMCGDIYFVPAVAGILSRMVIRYTSRMRLYAATSNLCLLNSSRHYDPSQFAVAFSLISGHVASEHRYQLSSIFTITNMGET